MSIEKPTVPQTGRRPWRRCSSRRTPTEALKLAEVHGRSYTARAQFPRRLIMKNLKWMLAVFVVGAGLGAAGGVLAAKNKEIVVTPDADVKFQPLDPSDKDGKGVLM